MRSIRDSLGSVLDADTIKALSEIACLRRCWPDIVGPMLAARSEPLSIEQDCLILVADHPVMAQELRLLQSQILKVCLKRFGMRQLRRLRTRIQDGVGMPAPASRRKPRDLSLQTCKSIVKSMRGLEDRELRQAFFRARAFQLMYADKERASRPGARNR